MAEVNEAKREKSQVEDINRSLYDFRYEEKDAYKVDAGLTPAIVEQISREKNDPDLQEVADYVYENRYPGVGPAD